MPIYTCKNSKGEISTHDTPCKQVLESVEHQPARIELNTAEAAHYWPWVFGLFIFGLACLAIAHFGEKALKAKEARNAWRQAVKDLNP